MVYCLINKIIQQKCTKHTPCIKSKSKQKTSQTCIKRSPLGQTKGGLLRRMTS